MAEPQRRFRMTDVYDAGITSKPRRDGTDGYVWRYKDPARAGVWYDEQGKPVSIEVARTAGFDVEKESIERRKAERIGLHPVPKTPS
jgi:hypothetical protein